MLQIACLLLEIGLVFNLPALDHVLADHNVWHISTHMRRPFDNSAKDLTAPQKVGDDLLLRIRIPYGRGQLLFHNSKDEHFIMVTLSEMAQIRAVNFESRNCPLAEGVPDNLLCRIMRDQ